MFFAMLLVAAFSASASPLQAKESEDWPLGEVEPHPQTKSATEAGFEPRLKVTKESLKVTIELSWTKTDPELKAAPEMAWRIDSQGAKISHVRESPGKPRAVEVLYEAREPRLAWIHFIAWNPENPALSWVVSLPIRLEPSIEVEF